MKNELKPHLSFEKQVASLRAKGFIISDNDECLRFLQSVNYYRLSAYYLPFRRPDGSYFENIDFSRIQNIYRFDQELRTLVFSVIETIETYLRTQIAYYHSEKYGPDGYMHADVYRSKHDHGNFISRIENCINENRTSLVVKHHENHYGGSFPLWVIIEFFSIGFLSHFYLDMKKSDKKRISSNLYGVTDAVLEGWLRCITDLRNKCAHYSRLYYWIFPALPQFPDDLHRPVFPESYRGMNKRRVFQQLYLLKVMYPLKDEWNWAFLFPLSELMDKYSESISLKHLGFPPDWRAQLSIDLEV